MKNNKGVTLVSLVVTIIVLVILAGVSINLVLGDNGIITKAKEAKENLELAKIEEEKELNELYTQLVSESSNLPYDSIAKLAEFKIAIANAIDEAGGVKPDVSAETSVFANNIKGIVKEVTKDSTATTNNILLGKTAWVNGNKLTGTMANNGALNSTLNAGGSFTIPAGYTSGGKVTANSLASQTSATATAAQILSGKTAWVNGNKLTGTMANRGTLNWNPSTSTTYTVPAGYYSGGTLSSSNAYNAGVTAGKNSVSSETLSSNMIVGTYVFTQEWATTLTLSNLSIKPYAILIYTENVNNLSYKCLIYGVGSSAFYYTEYANSTETGNITYSNNSVSVYVPKYYFRKGATINYIIFSENCFK